MDEYDGYSDASMDASPQADTRVRQREPGTLDANPHVNRPPLTNRLRTQSSWSARVRSSDRRNELRARMLLTKASSCPSSGWVAHSPNPWGEEASVYGWKADEPRRACASRCRSCRMPQSTLPSHLTGTTAAGFEIALRGELSVATTPRRSMTLDCWVEGLGGGQNQPPSRVSELYGQWRLDSQGLQWGWVCEGTYGTDAVFRKRTVHARPHPLSLAVQSSYSLRDRVQQRDVPPLTSLRGGLQSAGWNILGALVMGGCQHGLTVAAQGTEDGWRGRCQVVANQPHDEEVNLSDGDDSSPEVRSPRPSPAPRPRAFAFRAGCP